MLNAIKRQPRGEIKQFLTNVQLITGVKIAVNDRKLNSL
jgi:hypothetical protein